MRVDIGKVTGNVYNIEGLKKLNIQTSSDQDIRLQAAKIKENISEKTSVSAEELEHWLELIANNQIETVFDEWLANLDKKDAKTWKKISAQKARNEEIVGLFNDKKISSSEYLIEMNKIRAGLLNLIIERLKRK